MNFCFTKPQDRPWMAAVGAFVIFYAVATILRLLMCSGPVNLLMQQGYLIGAGISFVTAGLIFRFNLRVLAAYVLCVFLYLSVVWIKKSDGMLILDRETIHTLSFGVTLATLTALCAKAAMILPRRRLAQTARFVASVLAVATLFIPLLFGGYGIVSGGHLLSADIILTLFQTNPEETRAYLSEQNLLLWGICIFVMVSVPLFAAMIIYHKSVPLDNLKVVRGWYDKSKVDKLKAIFCGLWALYLIIGLLPNLKSSFVISTFGTVRETLKSFKVYEQTKELRAKRLDALKNALVSQRDEGVYMLVVGESTARNHMNAYGYTRPNTPWLSQMAQTPETVLFQNAYSNHVHTVPAVQYALTELNQYRPIDVGEAYSIVEVAKAAGYQTYWISNQKQFNVSDTPLTTIAASADRQIWLNSYAGNKTMTAYYDDKLADSLPALQKAKKALIVVHLMGCHAVYIERYPTEYNRFDEGNIRVDSYDNAILYNDHTLEKLYEGIKQNPNFMAMVYFSDHGEDPDNGYTHEASKFTYAMSRIPLLMIFSDKFKQTQPQLFDTLRAHRETYVTSDLLYNTMVGILGIDALPREERRFDLSSEAYGMSKENLLTVHGARRLADERP